MDEAHSLYHTIDRLLGDSVSLPASRIFKDLETLGVQADSVRLARHIWASRMRMLRQALRPFVNCRVNIGGYEHRHNHVNYVHGSEDSHAPAPAPAPSRPTFPRFQPYTNDETFSSVDDFGYGVEPPTLERQPGRLSVSTMMDQDSKREAEEEKKEARLSLTSYLLDIVRSSPIIDQLELKQMLDEKDPHQGARVALAIAHRCFTEPTIMGTLVNRFIKATTTPEYMAHMAELVRSLAQGEGLQIWDHIISMLTGTISTEATGALHAVSAGLVVKLLEQKGEIMQTLTGPGILTADKVVTLVRLLRSAIQATLTELGLMESDDGSDLANITNAVDGTISDAHDEASDGFRRS